MRSGQGSRRMLGACLLALLALAQAAPAAPAAPARASSNHTSLAAAVAPRTASSSAETTTIFTVTGTSFPGRVNAFVGPGGRLTVVSPEGIVEPDGPNPQCTQDSATQVSCEPGYVDVLAGDLRGGADVFTAAPSLGVGIGIDLVGPDRPLSGGAGRDQISGGSGSDLIEGGAGADALVGGGLTDVLRGGPGSDMLRGGGAPDLLLGGGGPDILNGGGGRDGCNGGPARDRGISCTSFKSIP